MLTEDIDPVMEPARTKITLVSVYINHLVAKCVVEAIYYALNEDGDPIREEPISLVFRRDKYQEILNEVLPDTLNAIDWANGKAVRKAFSGKLLGLIRREIQNRRVEV